MSYVRTSEGFEVDFHAQLHDSAPLLIQVSESVAAEETFTREVRALVAAGKELKNTKLRLITNDYTPPPYHLPGNIEWLPAAAWLLAEG